MRLVYLPTNLPQENPPFMYGIKTYKMPLWMVWVGFAASCLERARSRELQPKKVQSLIETYEKKSEEFGLAQGSQKNQPTHSGV